MLPYNYLADLIGPYRRKKCAATEMTSRRALHKLEQK